MRCRFVDGPYPGCSAVVARTSTPPPRLEELAIASAQYVRATLLAPAFTHHAPGGIMGVASLGGTPRALYGRRRSQPKPVRNNPKIRISDNNPNKVSHWRIFSQAILVFLHFACNPAFTTTCFAKLHKEVFKIQRPQFCLTEPSGGASRSRATKKAPEGSAATPRGHSKSSATTLLSPSPNFKMRLLPTS